MSPTHIPLAFLALASPPHMLPPKPHTPTPKTHTPQVDGRLQQTWIASLMLLWLWFGIIALLTLGVATLMIMARCTAQRGDSTLLPWGVLLLLVAIVPQFFSYLLLTSYLDNPVRGVVFGGVWGAVQGLRCCAYVTNHTSCIVHVLHITHPLCKS